VGHFPARVLFASPDGGIRRTMTQGSASSLLDSGIDVVGEMEWGTHISLFYETRADLVDVVVPFLAAGLLAGELCGWIPSDGEAEVAVRAGLRDRIPDLDERVARGHMEFGSVENWFRPDGQFDVDAVMHRWHELYTRSGPEHGFTGLRVCGDLGWVRKKDRDRSLVYEGRVHEFARGRAALILCTYPLEHTLAAIVLDIAHQHDFVLARRRGKWDSVETPEHRQALREIHRLNEELEQRVEQRTAQLIAERKRSTTRIAQEKRRAREQALEARFAAILEERTRMAREIHDSLLQGVAGIALQLRAALPHVKSAPPGLANTIGRIAELAENTAHEARQTVWEMRPLVTSDLPSALKDAARRASGRDVPVTVEGESRPLPPVVEDAILRIAQESTMNAFKHSGAGVVSVTLNYKEDAVSLTVSDSGRGFDVESAKRAYTRRWGLLGMQERANRIGASLSVHSRPGEGTTVELEVPLSRVGAANLSPARAL
jgi:signal transduction histidine kinase